MAPKISVVVSNHNCASYLDQRITSILRQTIEDFEVIIVDDASTDNSRSVIEKYCADPRIRTVWFETYSGSEYRRRNDGAAVATGEYLWFASAKHSCSDDWLEKLLHALESRSDAGMAYSRCWTVNAAGKPFRVRPTGDRWSKEFVANAVDELPRLLKGEAIPTVSAVLLRRSIFDACDGYDPAIKVRADSMLYAHALRVSKVAYVPGPCTYVRTSDASAEWNHIGQAEVWDMYRVVRFVMGAFPVQADDDEDTCRWLAETWCNRMLSERWRLDAALSLRIWREAREVDPLLSRRIVRAVSQRVYQAVETRLEEFNLRDRLSGIANRYGTDKGTRAPRTGRHGPRLSYTPVYHKYMKALRSKNVALLEIGIGTGASLRMWCDYFSKGSICGLDVVDRSDLNSERIETFVCDQSRRADLAHVADSVRALDIIIDDGSHVVSHQQIALGTLFPYLRRGAQYWIEDLHTSDADVWQGKVLYGNDMSFRDGESTVQVLESFQRTGVFESPFLSAAENDYLSENIVDCKMFTLPKTRWGINKLCLIRKKL